MFNFSKHAAPPVKCSFTHTSLPAFVDEDQPPTTRKPFTACASQPFNHRVDLLLPEELYAVIEHKLSGDDFVVRYSRVYISLEEIVEREFLDKHVKTGNVIMLSEGRQTVDNCFSLRNGILSLELDQPTYERVGLVGKPIPSGGRKHQKSRFLIELNLRLPSMRHGKKGFSRVQWAFKNVLNHSLTWLFYDMTNAIRPPDANLEQPIAKHHPFEENVKPQVHHINKAKVPVFVPPMGLNDYEYTADLLEWIGLAILDSPRVQANDPIDPYLSRYSFPIAQDMDGNDVGLSESDLVIVSWRGFMPPSFVEKLFTKVRRQAGKEWFALTAAGFNGEGYSVVNQSHEVLTWEWPARNK